MSYCKFFTPQKNKINQMSNDEILTNYFQSEDKMQNCAKVLSERENFLNTPGQFDISSPASFNSKFQNKSVKNNCFTSPSYKKDQNPSDRFIPLRQNNNIARNLFGLPNEELDIPNQNFEEFNATKNLKSCKNFSIFAKSSEKDTQKGELQTEEEEKTQKYKDMLKEQTLDYVIKKQICDPSEEDTLNDQNSNSFLKFKNISPNFDTPSKKIDFYNSPIQNKVFPSFMSPDQSVSAQPTSDMFGSFKQGIYQKKQQKRKISTQASKVLDAPGLKDDYYVDILDWGSKGKIAVVLENNIYLWDSDPNSKCPVISLDNETSPQFEYTSLKFNKTADKLAVGQKNGFIQIYDIEKQLPFFQELHHDQRVGNIQWINNNLFASGSKDKHLIIHDIRDKQIVSKFKDHKQEICGMASCYNEQQLATGGNDNLVFLYDLKKMVKQYCFKDHSAAVRALTFTPHQHGILLTGGGTKDKTIKTWDTLNHSLIRSTPVESQVCKLLFTQNTNEFISSHGFEDNGMIIWKCQNLKQYDFQKLQVLDGHKDRVLYMAISPDNQKVVSGAGDETLKFWDVFPEKPTIQMQSKLTFESLR